MGEEVQRRARNARGSGRLLRDDIVGAAVRVIDKGVPLTLRSVAREAGITAPAIYPHFADLEALEAEVMTVSFADLAASVRSGMASMPDPVGSLLAGSRAYVEFGWAHRHRYRLMFSRGAFAENAMDTFLAAEQAIVRCVEAGESASEEPRADTYLLWLGLHGIATLERPTRLDYLGLTTPGRPSFLIELVHRMARLLPHAAPALPG